MGREVKSDSRDQEISRIWDKRVIICFVNDVILYDASIHEFKTLLNRKIYLFCCVASEGRKFKEKILRSYLDSPNFTSQCFTVRGIY